MRIRPEAERKLRAGFQRHVDEQSARYAAELAHAAQLATGFECGEVAGVFSAKAGGNVKRSALVAGFLPLAAIPLLIVAAASGFPGTLPLLGGFPFIWAAWFALFMILGRESKRTVWCYAFTEGFMLLDGPRSDTVPVRWSHVTEVSPVWTQVYDIAAEEYRKTLTAYRLRTADGEYRVISRSLKNVKDPYREVGQLLKAITPASFGNTMPALPTIDQIIAAYAGRRGPNA